MFDRRLRLRPNIKTTLGQRLVSAGVAVILAGCWRGCDAFFLLMPCWPYNKLTAGRRSLVVGYTWSAAIGNRFMYNKWNESGFRPPLCTYRLNWARRTSWGWWDDWDDTVLQTQDSKFEPWRSEAEHATSRSRRLPTILTFTRGWGRNNFVSFKPPRPGTEPRTLAWKAAVLTTTLGPPPFVYNIWPTSDKTFQLIFSDAGPALNLHWVNVSCLLGLDKYIYVRATQ